MEQQSRRGRAQVAEETIRVLDAGSYTIDGQEVSIADVLRRAVEGTRAFPPQCTFHPAAAAGQPGDAVEGGSAQIEITSETTLQAGRRLHAELGEAAAARGLCLLNFASAKNPGGGFRGGAQAQEESLARSSGLYPCLVGKAGEFYDVHRAQPDGGLYSHRMIHSPQVPFFREDSGAFLPTWCANVITSAAPNAGVALRNRSAEDLQQALTERIGLVLSLARHEGHSTLVLGAFGCGVFRNDPTQVAREFQHWLVGPPRMARAFRRVVFAIPHGRDGNLEAFCHIFRTPVPARPPGVAREADEDQGPEDGAAAPAAARGDGRRPRGGKGGGKQQPRSRKEGRWRKAAQTEDGTG